MLKHDHYLLNEQRALYLVKRVPIIRPISWKNPIRHRISNSITYPTNPKIRENPGVPPKRYPRHKWSFGCHLSFSPSLSSHRTKGECYPLRRVRKWQRGSDPIFFDTRRIPGWNFTGQGGPGFSAGIYRLPGGLTSGISPDSTSKLYLCPTSWTIKTTWTYCVPERCRRRSQNPPLDPQHHFRSWVPCGLRGIRTGTPHSIWCKNCEYWAAEVPDLTLYCLSKLLSVSIKTEHHDFESIPRSHNTLKTALRQALPNYDSWFSILDFHAANSLLISTIVVITRFFKTCYHVLLQCKLHSLQNWTELRSQ